MKIKVIVETIEENQQVSNRWTHSQMFPEDLQRAMNIPFHMLLGSIMDEAKKEITELLTEQG